MACILENMKITWTSHSVYICPIKAPSLPTAVGLHVLQHSRSDFCIACKIWKITWKVATASFRLVHYLIVQDKNFFSYFHTLRFYKMWNQARKFHILQCASTKCKIDLENSTCIQSGSLSWVSEIRLMSDGAGNRKPGAELALSCCSVHNPGHSADWVHCIFISRPAPIRFSRNVPISA